MSELATPEDFVQPRFSPDRDECETKDHEPAGNQTIKDYSVRLFIDEPSENVSFRIIVQF
jgi:hypothetical protein